MVSHMKKNLILFALIGTLQFCKAQNVETKSQIGEVFKAIVKLDSVQTRILSVSLNYIRDFEFDGDYSRERLFPSLFKFSHFERSPFADSTILFSLTILSFPAQKR